MLSVRANWNTFLIGNSESIKAHIDNDSIESIWGPPMSVIFPFL